MKTLFIHFSDIHLQEPFNQESSYDLLLNAIIPSLKNSKRVFLLFTGDMARRARDVEINYFELFIERIRIMIEQHSKCDVCVLIVPGNHDIKLSSAYNLDTILNSNSEQLDALSAEAINNMSHSLSLCKKYGCFVNNDFFSVNIFKYDGIIYRFTLINSAPLSSLRKEDKGHHHIPVRDVSFDYALEHNRKTVDIFMSHHRPDWFDEDNLAMLDNYISQHTSLAFFGHEHLPSSDVCGRNGRVVVVSKGGELQPKENKIVGSFSLLMFDEETQSAEETVININYQSKAINYSEKVVHKVFCNESFPMKKEFEEEFIKSPLKNGEGNLLDFFVFPALSQQTVRNDILTIELAIKKAKEQGLMVLCGGSRSGKTTLLKAMFWSVQKEHPCVFIKATPDLSNNIERNVKNAFCEIYGDESSLWTNFKNSLKSEKAIFIDDFGSLRKKSIKEACLKYCLDNFGVVVIAYFDSSQPLDSLEDRILFEESNVYKIEGLTAKSRLLLVKKICNVKNISNEDTELISSVYDAMSTSTKILDFIDPDYAVQLIESIIDNKLYVERRVHDAFSAVFSTSINNDIMRVSSRDYLDGILAVLREIAYLVWSKNQQIIFSEQEIRLTYDYAKNHGLIRTDYVTFMRIICDSGVVVRKDDDNYSFKRNSYLSFFVAKSIAVRINRGKTEDLLKLENNIQIGINSDVLLFLCYDLSRIDVLFNVKDKLLEILSPVEEIDFETKNNKLLIGSTLIPEESEESKISRKEALDKKESAERDDIVSKRKEEENVFKTEDEDEETNKLIVCIKYLEIISKAGGSFPGILEDSDREILTKAIVSSINKITQSVYYPSEELISQYSELLDEYKAVETERVIKSGSGDVDKKVSDIRNIKLEDFLFGDLLKMLTMLDSVFANFLASQHSIKSISALPSDKFAYSVFKLYSYLYCGNFDRFIKELKHAYDTFKTQRGDNLYKFFGRVYILKNHCSNEQIDKISSLTGLQKSYLIKIASRE